MSPSKRKCLSITQKVEIIAEMERGAKNFTMSEKYSIPTSTISSILKNKETISAAFDKCPQLKKLRKCEKEELDKWHRTKKQDVNGPILKMQAERFAKMLGYRCNYGWLTRFKNRNGMFTPKMPNKCMSQMPK